MLCGAGAEPVLDEVVGAGQQPEVGGADDEVQIGLARAHRAVAVEDVEIRRRQDLESHAFAMTAARVPARLAAVQVRGAFHGGASNFAR